MLKARFLYLFLVAQFFASAQMSRRSFAQNEIGLFAGGSYYIGDLNPRGHFLYSKPAAGIYYRFTNHYRYAFKFGLNYGTLYANDANSKEADQKERNLNFKSTLYEFSSIAEFNFVDYSLAGEKDNFTFYMFAGLAGYYFNPQTNIGTGYKSLIGVKTEGQSKSYSKYQVSIPFGVGVKFKVKWGWGLGFEWGPRKVFTDYLDDVSGTYPDFIGSSSETNPYTDRTKNGSASPGSMRGNPTTKDWYFFYGVNLNYMLPSNKGNVCHSTRISHRKNRGWLRRLIWG